MFDSDKYAILSSQQDRRGANGLSIGILKPASARLPLLLAVLSVMALGAAASVFAGDAIPAEVSAGSKKEILSLHAEGVQIYECKADGSAGSKWTFREPLATLLQNGKTVGRHFAGPSWELTSGSAVVGKVEAQAPGKTASDIAVLKLAVADKRGGGELASVTTIQRLDTRGGVFAGACEAPGMLHLEPYSAEYVFLGD